MAELTPPSATSNIRYGEFVESIHNTINLNEGQFWSFPLYGKSRLFAMAGLTKPPRSELYVGGIGNAYSITRYIYCTVKGDVGSLWETGTAWVGYIAESSEAESQRLGRRDIVVAIRGTIGTGEWIKNLQLALADFPFVQTPTAGAQVHRGFLSIYTSTDPTVNFGAKSMREQIFTELRTRLPNGTSSTSSLPVGITITGHSLGGALATLVACDVGCNLAVEFANTNVTVSAITFGSPMVGNNQFKTNAEKHTAFIWRYRSITDPVPFVPPSVPILFPYVHVGTELVLDWQPSPYVSISIPSWGPFTSIGHNLELHMHAMAAESIYTSTQLEDLLARFPLSRGAGASSTDVIEDISQMPAWDDVDRDLLKHELEDVKDCLKDDQSAIFAYLKEVNYIALTRQVNIVAAPPRLHAAVPDSPFDRRDFSLLNKAANILKQEYAVPAQWLVHPNKDMVRDPNSHQWLPRVERPHDIPTPENPEFN